YVFFFSSRRRHTRSKRDWSSDVCSSDLEEYSPKNWLSKLLEINIANLAGVPSIIYGLLGLEFFVRIMKMGNSILAGSLTLALLRSEERRVGKVCSSGWCWARGLV